MLLLGSWPPRGHKYRGTTVPSLLHLFPPADILPWRDSCLSCLQPVLCSGSLPHLHVAWGTTVPPFMPVFLHFQTYPLLLNSAHSTQTCSKELRDMSHLPTDLHHCLPALNCPLQLVAVWPVKVNDVGVKLSVSLEPICWTSMDKHPGAARITCSSGFLFPFCFRLCDHLSCSFFLCLGLSRDCCLESSSQTSLFAVNFKPTCSNATFMMVALKCIP